MENPLKTYYKIKKYFRPLSFQLVFETKRNPKKWFSFEAKDVQWEKGENEPKFIASPYLKITLFKYKELKINWFLTKCPDKIYWTAALYWLYYNKTLSKAVKLASKRHYQILHKEYQDLFYLKQLRKIYAKE